MSIQYDNGNSLSEEEIAIIRKIHLLGLFTFVLGPLYFWFRNRESSDFIDDHGKEVLNLFITLIIAHVISCLLWFVYIGILFTLLVGLYQCVMLVIGMVEASNGQRYRFPYILRFLK